MTDQNGNEIAPGTVVSAPLAPPSGAIPASLAPRSTCSGSRPGADPLADAFAMGRIRIEPPDTYQRVCVGGYLCTCQLGGPCDEAPNPRVAAREPHGGPQGPSLRCEQGRSTLPSGAISFGSTSLLEQLW